MWEKFSFYFIEDSFNLYFVVFQLTEETEVLLFVELSTKFFYFRSSENNLYNLKQELYRENQIYVPFISILLTSKAKKSQKIKTKFDMPNVLLEKYF